ncbi:MAG: PIN domain-containing protein [Nitrospirae bacterium]|nr:PIN domain-containing protein [Nitrospirota bacterium]
MKIFVDTGAWIAIADRSDQYAKSAGQCYSDLILQRTNLITSDMVLVETFNLLSRTIGNKATLKFGDALKNIVFLSIEPVTPIDWEQAWKIFGKYHDKDFSFTDCTSFALMERLKIKSAFAFDIHFKQYGFVTLP